MTPAVYYTHFGGEPFFNMAFDEWMFGKAMQNPDRVYLRLYSWSPGAITFGYHQDITKAVRHDNLGDTILIRRITGGRALYHDPSELTYAIAFNSQNKANSKLCGTVRESSQIIASALVSFLESIGISAQYVRQSVGHKKTKAYFQTIPCFDSVARHEIVGKPGKIVASAQRRIETTFLQHGAIKIGGIASHPALPTNTFNAEEVLQPLEYKHFQQFSVLFQK